MKFLSTILIFIAIMSVCSYSKNSECEVLMDKILYRDYFKSIGEYKVPIFSISGECIDATNAYFYTSYIPDVLMFISVSKDSFKIDSIVDFKHSFIKYNIEELKDSISINIKADEFSKIIDNIRRKVKYSYTFDKPVIYKKKDYYQLVDNRGIYKISFKDKKFEKLFYFWKIKSSDTLKTDVNKEEHKGFVLVLYDIGKKVYFSPEYTKITFTGAITSSITIYENGKFTVDMSTNITPGLCLSIGKVLTEEEKKVTGSKDIETVEIVNFGLDCK